MVCMMMIIAVNCITFQKLIMMYDHYLKKNCDDYVSWVENDGDCCKLSCLSD